MTVRIGCGSAYAEDRLDPAVELIEGGELDFVSLDCLAERTLCHAQLRKLADPATGYDIRLDEIVQRLVVPCVARGTTFVANMGAANPSAGADRTRSLLQAAGVEGVKAAAITGDDVLDVV